MTRMPQVTARDLVRFLKAQGFTEDRQSGSHLTLLNRQREVIVTVPMHTGTDIGRGLAVRILKSAGFSVEDFLRLRQTPPESVVVSCPRECTAPGLLDS